MKNVFTLLLFLLFVLPSYAGVIVLEGHYQGKNLYVQNPFAGSGVGFCTFEVTINGNVTTDEVNSSAFEIDFTAVLLKIGDPVIVKIKHKDDCKPKVLNPEVLKPKSTFEIVSMNVSKDGVFKWTTIKESGKLAFIIEHFRWNKWVKVGEVDGNGKVSTNNYEFKIEPHSGNNKFRVKQIDYSGEPRYSDSSAFLSDKEIVTFSPIKVKDVITFSSSTLYEIYDNFANIVKKGYGISVDVSNLKKGIYYLNYDNKSETFLKK